jgi:hypothetical protein
VVGCRPAALPQVKLRKRDGKRGLGLRHEASILWQCDD